jgi:putative endonuclease
MIAGRIPELITTVLDRLSLLLRRREIGPAHLRTGRKGEDLAFYFLRRQGYTIVARNWRSKGRKGEIDLIGWEGKTLCFIEVKTRSSHGIAPAETAVNPAKQSELRGMAALFLGGRRPRPSFRFDVVSVYLVPGKPREIDLFKDAFSRRTMGGKRRPLI